MVNKKKVGLVFGTLAGGIHLVWSVLILLGVAQTLLDFSLWAHMVHVSVIIGPFDAAAALTLIVVASVVGYVVGYIGASIWNRVHS